METYLCALNLKWVAVHGMVVYNTTFPGLLPLGVSLGCKLQETFLAQSFTLMICCSWSSNELANELVVSFDAFEKFKILKSNWLIARFLITLLFFISSLFFMNFIVTDSRNLKTI